MKHHQLCSNMSTVTYQQQSARLQVAWVPKVEQAGVVETGAGAGQLLVQALLLLHMA
jgi:hypothetical protein